MRLRRQSMTLRYAAIDAEGKLSDEAELDESRVRVLPDGGGTLTGEDVIVVYRDRSNEEMRDIYIARHVVGGAWSASSGLSRTTGRSMAVRLMALRSPRMHRAWRSRGIRRRVISRKSSWRFRKMPVRRLDERSLLPLAKRWDVLMCCCYLMVLRSCAGCQEQLRRGDQSAADRARRDAWSGVGRRANRHLTLEWFPADGSPRQRSPFRLDRVRQAILRQNRCCRCECLQVTRERRVGSTLLITAAPPDVRRGSAPPLSHRVNVRATPLVRALPWRFGPKAITRGIAQFLLARERRGIAPPHIRAAEPQRTRSPQQNTKPKAGVLGPQRAVTCTVALAELFGRVKGSRLELVSLVHRVRDSPGATVRRGGVSTLQSSIN